MQFFLVLVLTRKGDMEMFAIIILLGAVLFVGMVFFVRRNEMKPVPVSVESTPVIGDIVRYTDKRTGLYRGQATVVGYHRRGLVTLRHGQNARPFSVRPSRIH
ncbi:MAG: hypothetical protein AAB935_00790 [Patescibacteria group bacterium]